MKKEKWLKRWEETFGSAIEERIRRDIAGSLHKKFNVDVKVRLVNTIMEDCDKWLEELGVKYFRQTKGGIKLRPWTKERYPKNWKKISKSHCEEVGYCELCDKEREEVPWLTTHHIDGNPANNKRENWCVCCPRCHFAIQVAGYISPEAFRKNKLLQTNLFKRG